MNTLSEILSTINHATLPALAEKLESPLGEKGQLFVRVINLCQPETLVASYRWCGVGCPPKDRLPILQAFLAKAVWNLPTTRALLDRLRYDPTLRRLCGWERAGDVPSEATFSRAFARFAKNELPGQIHQALIGRFMADKLVGHLSRDATAIEAREKATPKPPKPAKPKAKIGRPKKGEPRPPEPPKRLELQGSRSLEQNLADLPRVCDMGAKQNAKGVNQYWCGYKLHLDVADGQIPISALLSSASLQDCQAAIPLAQLSAGRVRSLYDLMDVIYDAAPITAFSRSLGHVPIITPNAGRGHTLPLAPAQKKRFEERTTVERVNSDLKDNHGGTMVRVRGAVKVFAHLMLGVIVVAVKGLCGLVG